MYLLCCFFNSPFSYHLAENYANQDLQVKNAFKAYLRKILLKGTSNFSGKNTCVLHILIIPFFKNTQELN